MRRSAHDDSNSPGSGAAAGWSESWPLLAGDDGTEQTLDVIRRAIWDGLSDERVRSVAADIVRQAAAYDDYAAALAIFDYVQTHIRFTNDPVGHETISTPNWTLTHGIGDCDDFATVIATLCMTVGIPAMLVTVANDPDDAETFTHIYAIANVNGQWIPLDAARPGATFGTEVAHVYRKRIWSLIDQTYEDLQGLSGVVGMGADINLFDIFRPGGATDIQDFPGGSDDINVGGIISSIGNSISNIVRATRGAPSLTVPAVTTSSSPSILSAPGMGSTLPLLLAALAGGALLFGGKK